MGFTPIPYQRYVITHKSTEFRGDLYTRCLYDGVKSDVLDWQFYHIEKNKEDYEAAVKPLNNIKSIISKMISRKPG